MSTKQQIKTNIDTQYASGLGMPISNVRGVLKNDTHSLLNNIYPNKINDTQATQNEITLTDDNTATFDVDIVKTGRVVTITGTFSSVGSTVAYIGEITRAEFAAKLQTAGTPARGMFGTGRDGSNQVWLMEVVNEAGTTYLKIIAPTSGLPFLAGKTINFAISYFTDL